MKNQLFTFYFIIAASVALAQIKSSDIVNLNNTKISSIACGLSSTGSCSAPNLIAIGTGTNVNPSTNYPAIYSNWYKNARHQILYLASELSAAGVLPGKISSISWNIITINGTSTYPNFSIKMKCTNEIDLVPASPFDSIGLMQVYFAPNSNITTGWNTYNFQNAYVWDGVSNLLIDVCTDFTTIYTNNSSSPYTATSFNSVKWVNSDITQACGLNSYSSGYTTNTTYRPNIKFGNCDDLTSTGEQIKKTTNIIIYPNPTSGEITLNMDDSNSAHEYRIYDQLGREVKKGKLQSNKSTINLDLQSGLYFIAIGNRVAKIQVIN
jgi:hypothetical protein